MKNPRKSVPRSANGLTIPSQPVAHTAFGLVQAAGEYLDHVRRYRTAETKMNRSLLTVEPLKAKAAELLPGMAKHSFALRDIVAARGRVDPGALILRVQGFRALANLPRIVRLLARRKINPLKTLLRIRTAAAEAAGRILGVGIVK